ncbi:MAG: DUF4936 family protein [Burkholderiaceae bacterium]
MAFAPGPDAGIPAQALCACSVFVYFKAAVGMREKVDAQLAGLITQMRNSGAIAAAYGLRADASTGGQAPSEDTWLEHYGLAAGVDPVQWQQRLSAAAARAGLVPPTIGERHHECFAWRR